MTEQDIRELLEKVADGRLQPAQALESLRSLPFENMGFACLDSHRQLRTGFPEVVFGAGKTTEQMVQIGQRIVAQGGPLLITRINPEQGKTLLQEFPAGVYLQTGRLFYWTASEPQDLGRGAVAVVCAGTSDLPVAEEAAVTAWLMGNRVEKLYDVGVAGLHRLLDRLESLRRAEVIVAVAGMEGALPSVLAGLVGRPVIAVPTSVGYGASFGGLAALLAMLNSCAPGVCVVNIDNGFGAGCAAALLNRRREDRLP